MPRVNVHEIIRPTDATYAIEVEQGLLDLKLILGDHNGRPFKSQPYALRFFRDSVTPDRTGTTDGSGMLHEKVPMTVREVLVSLPDLGFAWPVSIEAVGALPVSATESLGTRGVPDYGDACAIQARLNALGIPAGAAGAWDEDTRQALLQLRRARGSDDHGPLNDDDLRALESFGV